jgi:hypothetical protein
MGTQHTTSDKPLTAVQRQRRAQWKQLVLSLHTPQCTSIKSAQPVIKAHPGVGAFATS